MTCRYSSVQPALLVGKLTFLNDAHALLQSHLPDTSVDPIVSLACTYSSLHRQVLPMTAEVSNGGQQEDKGNYELLGTIGVHEISTR